ncbi:MAG: RecQ family ATP-dependent DNA helicase [Desulfopila sp.]|jgi:ATP-dependent DNA helicase RecQ|nr:RecQ family ATP-dependent DNA helicase [Desulfopila sp.]
MTMSSQCEQFLQRCLLLDIEVNEEKVIYSIGAVFRGEAFSSPSGKPIDTNLLNELDQFGKEAEFLLGHNILAHDLPQLVEAAPGLELHTRPAVDTLYLSPLAFPENPYHRLVKDYQIVRDSINNPAQDALLAGKIFSEQWDAFEYRLNKSIDAPLLYRSFLQTDESLNGTARALEAIGIPALSGDDLYEAFSWYASKYACVSAVQKIVDQLVDGELEHAQFAYICAWLSVAGGNSVLPPWVRHRYATIPSLLHQLREVPCHSPACEYCSRYHNPLYYLKRFYGFDTFRETPATADGKSLQEEIVQAAAANATIFATLPTGGGKSLCYLLPALMRYQRRNMLTIVISPLQALMKDQVDNFANQTGTRTAAAIYGLQTMPERGVVQEGVRLGDIGILYVSPEQLRNKSFVATIAQREIGAWIFDEAHCLSKWGHDFRPDYLYAVKFIREFAVKAGVVIPPVQCFTATAKTDVRQEIIDLVQSELGFRVVQFEGGHERANLRYEVWSVDPHEKYGVIEELLKARYDGKGSVVIYCSSRKKTENLAEFLQERGYEADAFHAGLEPTLKRRIQESFIEGTTPIICATNAFGMGIDKDDVRLVIHADIPGSLENYLQEAGRAGRDREHAECILIFADQDIEGQFSLSASSRLTQKDIAQLLKGIKTAAKDRDSIVLTPGEIMRLESVDIDPVDFGAPDTKVKTAVAWLERAGYLERKENDNRIFTGKPLVGNIDKARERIAELNLSRRQQERWLAIMQLLMERRSSKGFSADEIASLTSFGSQKDDPETETEAQRVIRTLDDMAQQGLLAKETTLSAFIRYKTADNSEVRLARLSSVEREFLKILRESAPEVDLETPLSLDLRQINQQLIDAGHEKSSPQCLRSILYGLSRDGKGIAGQKGSLTVAAAGGDIYAVHLHRDWESLEKTVKIRQQAAVVTLGVMQRVVPSGTKPGANLLVDFSLESIIAGLRKDLLLFSQLKDPLAVAERALTYMHEQSIIDLQQGLAVFRQAMTLVLSEENRGRYYTKADFEPLRTHYKERNFQIHVMNEYARRALDKLAAAKNLVTSYFQDDKAEFVKRYFPGREKFLEFATTEQSYQRIVDDLKNRSQEKIVAAKTDANILILAGPGSGKTRVVAHRVAYLLRVKRVPARSILVLCFNRGAVQSLRKRIRDLVGRDIRGVTALTFHGLALRLTGRSLVPGSSSKRAEEIDYSQIIKDANALLRGEVDSLGFEQDSPRDILVGRFSHILVDEYQDIDEDQYELISLLAGRTAKESDLKLSILAVGDDDQNIYRFRGANIGFIRKFREDYRADIHYLVENYRSSANIIRVSNHFISQNEDRMKTEHPIVVNRARAALPKGGNWQHIDHLAEGRVQLLQVKDDREQAAAVLSELKRLRAVSDSFSLSNTAILAREWQELDCMRSCFEEEGIPVNLNWGKSAFPGLSRIREYSTLLRHLRENSETPFSATSLLRFLSETDGKDTIWQMHLRGLVEEWRDETNDSSQPVPKIEEYLYESLADQHRSRHLSNGVFLSTVHSVKGLEFDHVFVLGGSWRVKSDAELEEERRLFYVAMTRARETLQLFELDNACNPHTIGVNDEALMKRRIIVPEGTLPPKKRYHILGMKDLYLGYAGSYHSDHIIHTALKNCRAGGWLKPVVRDDHIYLVNSEGTTVARFSKAARDVWLSKVDSIEKVTVLAMVRRGIDDITDKNYTEHCKCESWEIPVCELVMNYGSQPRVAFAKRIHHE